MAELYQATRGRQRAREGGSLAAHGAHGGAVGARRLSPRARVRRRPAPDRLAILHELRRAPVHSGRSPGRGGVRTVPPVVPARRREGLGEGPLAPRLTPDRRGGRAASGWCGPVLPAPTRGPAPSGTPLAAPAPPHA